MSPDECMIWIPLGDDFWALFRIQYVFGSTVDTIHASVFGGWGYFTHFLRVRGLPIQRSFLTVRHRKWYGLLEGVSSVEQQWGAR